MMEHTKALVYAGLKIGELVGALSDGFQLGDLPEALKAAKSVKPAIDNAGGVWQELTNATDADREDLKAYVKANFDIADDKLEAAIETGVYFAIDALALANLFEKKAA